MSTVQTQTKETIGQPFIIQGYDPDNRCWITDAEQGKNYASLPNLSASLITDSYSLTPYIGDYGHLIYRTPLAVCRPTSTEDVLAIVRFAKQHQLRIVCRGAGHTGFGQTLVEAGIVLDMQGLNQIHVIEKDHAVVDAGVIWRDLLKITVTQGLTPPVLTDYTRLTVGGTLSVGGVSGRSYQFGAQVDNVLSLEVVTLEGDLLTCSETVNRTLFESVLAGLGLTAIIVRATIRLIPAKQRARTWRFFYPELHAMLGDMRHLTYTARFDHIRGNSAPIPDGFAYFIEATAFYNSSADLPDTPRQDLQFISGREQTEDRSYLEFTDLIVELIDQWTTQGINQMPNPWLDLFVGDSAIDVFASQTMAGLDRKLFLPGTLLLFFPFLRSQMKCPMLRVPDEELFFLFDVLRNVPKDPAVVKTVLDENRKLYEQNKRLGGTFYTISAVPLESQDWQTHFGAHWDTLISVKQRYDPKGLLGAELGVFK